MGTGVAVDGITVGVGAIVAVGTAVAVSVAGVEPTGSCEASTTINIALMMNAYNTPMIANQVLTAIRQVPFV